MDMLKLFLGEIELIRAVTLKKSQNVILFYFPCHFTLWSSLSEEIRVKFLSFTTTQFLDDFDKFLLHASSATCH